MSTQESFSVVDSLREAVTFQESAPHQAKPVWVGVDSSWGRKCRHGTEEMETLASLGPTFITTPVFILILSINSNEGPIHVPVIAEIILVRTAGWALSYRYETEPGPQSCY
jgi:hypothetical protein